MRILTLFLICSRVNGYINSSFGPFKMKEKEGLLLILKLIGLIEIVNVAFYKSIELLKFSKLHICKI